MSRFKIKRKLLVNYHGYQPILLDEIFFVDAENFETAEQMAKDRESRHSRHHTVHSITIEDVEAVKEIFGDDIGRTS